MTIIIKLSQFLLNIIYFFIKFFPIRKKIVLISRQSNTPSIDFKMIEKEINKSHPDYQVVLMNRKIEKGFIASLVYSFHLIRQLYNIATSQVVILDSYNIAISVLHHKKRLLVIQMWHSVGTMKKFGYSILDKTEGRGYKVSNLMKMHRGYDYIFAAGYGYVEHVAEGFNYPKEQVVVKPLPRIEMLRNEKTKAKKEEEILKQYPNLKNKKTIVYCPTFRKNDDYNLTIAIEQLIENLDFNKYNLIIKTHPLSNVKIDDENVIFDNLFTSLDMLFVADIIISDFSCIIYEAAILNKPIYFYTYDYDEYMSSREVYIDYKKEVPGPICNNAKELVNQLDINNYDYQKLKRFVDKYITITRDDLTSDIVEFIFDNIKIK